MKRVIITGASSGLGLALSKQFFEKGFDVVGICRGSPPKGAKHIKTDLTKEQDIENAIAVIKKDFSKFEYLINCAGALAVRALGEFQFKEIDMVFKVNAIAPMKLVSGLLENIKANEADIVNVGSTASYKILKNQFSYGSSKYALKGFTRNLEAELFNTPCRVIGFNPGGFKSEIFERATGKKINLDSYMEAEDIASFLIQILELPKNMEVTEITINRKFPEK